MNFTSPQLLERANMSLIFGISFVIIGFILLRFNKKPDTNNMKDKNYKEQLRTTFGILFYTRSKGLFQIGLLLIFVSVIFYVWYLIK